MSPAPSSVRPAVLAAVLLATAAAAAPAAAQLPPGFPRLDPVLEWEVHVGREPAEAAAVAAARDAVADLAVPGGVTVEDATAVDPLSLRFTGRERDRDRVLAALRGAGLLGGTYGSSGREPGGGPFDAAAAAAAVRDRLAGRGPFGPVDPGGPPRPQRVHYGLAGPLGDSADTARAAVASLPDGLRAAFVTPPAADHRSLLLTMTADFRDVLEVKAALLDAGLRVGGYSARPERDEPAAAAGADGRGDAGTDRGAAADVQPRLLTVTFDAPPGGGGLPDFTAVVRDRVAGSGVADAELLVADWPGRTVLIQYTGTRGDSLKITVALAADDAQEAMYNAMRAVSNFPPDRPAGPLPPSAFGEAGRRMALRGRSSEVQPLPAGYEPPTREAREVTLTFPTPVPGNPAANTAAVRRAAAAAVVGPTRLTAADWAAGEATVRFVGYPWGGARIAEAVKAAGATVSEHDTAPLRRD